MAHRQGHIPKIELMDTNRAVSSAILETPEDDQCWSKHVVCIRHDVEEILKFKAFKGFKMQVACNMANNKQGIKKQ
jgi:hypothetical protein